MNIRTHRACCRTFNWSRFDHTSAIGTSHAEDREHPQFLRRRIKPGMESTRMFGTPHRHSERSTISPITACCSLYQSRTQLSNVQFLNVESSLASFHKSKDILSNLALYDLKCIQWYHVSDSRSSIQGPAPTPDVPSRQQTFPEHTPS